LFHCLRSKTYTSNADKEYWEKKDWLNKDYFYNAKLNFTKRVFSKAMKGPVLIAVKRYIKRIN
jgi:hypothetical protein